MAANDQNFDPSTQIFTLYQADGITPFNVSITDLDVHDVYKGQICINYGAQLGASILMLLVVSLITRESKRRSSLFFLNIFSLFLSTIRTLLQTLYWIGPFNENYAYFSGDFSAVPRSAYASSVASIIMTFILLCTIQVSLVMQTSVVCSTLRSNYRLGLTMLSTVVALLAIGFRFANMVQNAEAILAIAEEYYLMWIASASLITETISIWYFCTIFTGKLAITLYQRRKLGMKQWGPMQIICIMGGCTMFIPSIFAILEYFPDKSFPEAGSLTLTLVAILLPLSGIWAAAAIDAASPLPSSPFSSDSRSKLNSTTSSNSSSTFANSIATMSSTDFNPHSQIHNSLSTTTAEHYLPVGANVSAGRKQSTIKISEQRLDDVDWLAKGVRVERSYSVHSARQMHGDGIGRD